MPEKNKRYGLTDAVFIRIIYKCRKTQGYRQVGKARVSESRMRWFESSYPCHMKMSIAQAMLFSYLWAVSCTVEKISKKIKITVDKRVQLL